MCVLPFLLIGVLGVTIVEGKLQIVDAGCMKKLDTTEIKIWVFIGDKKETTIDVSFSWNLLRQGMQQIIIHLDILKFQALGGDYPMIVHSIARGKEMIITTMIKSEFDSKDYLLFGIGGVQP